MSKIKFAIIGAGHIGKRHAEMVRRDAEGELVAIVDPRGAEACDAQDFQVWLTCCEARVSLSLARSLARSLVLLSPVDRLLVLLLKQKHTHSGACG